MRKGTIETGLAVAWVIVLGVSIYKANRPNLEGMDNETRNTSALSGQATARENDNDLYDSPAITGPNEISAPGPVIYREGGVEGLIVYRSGPNTFEIIRPNREQPYTSRYRGVEEWLNMEGCSPSNLRYVDEALEVDVKDPNCLDDVPKV